MHQDHNLRWNIVAQNFEFIRMNKKLTPCKTDLFARNLPGQAKCFTHFSRVFSRTVREFSISERAKYPARIDINKSKLSSGPLLSPDYPHYVRNSILPHNPNIEYWIRRAIKNNSAYGESNRIYYGTCDAKLAEVVKILLAANEIEPLLILANHPDVPLYSLNHLSWGHSFGINHVAEETLRSYILFNVALAVFSPSELQKGYLLEMHSYKRTIDMVTSWADYDAHTFPHRDFFFKNWKKDSFNCSIDNAINPLSDISSLHEYLKMCWELLYRYDMVMSECGVDIDWEYHVFCAIKTLWPNVKTDYCLERNIRIFA